MPNPTPPRPHGPIAVDLEDQPVVMAHKWKRRQSGYATRNYNAGRGRPWKELALHRVLMDAQPGEFIDHANGDILDNRRANLRRCTKAQNCQNARLRVDSTTGFRGVSFRTKRTKKGYGEPEYYACIRTEKRTEYLGRFPTAEGAARAYDEAARRLHVEFARCNFPEPVVLELGAPGKWAHAK